MPLKLITILILFAAPAFGAERHYADSRCSGPGRYDAMREGADCSNPSRMSSPTGMTPIPANRPQIETSSGLGGSGMTGGRGGYLGPCGAGPCQ